MSTGQVVRKRLRVRERSARAFEQRLFARFPWLAAPGLRFVARLEPSSRLRQRLLVRGLVLSLQAFNRGDLDAIAPTRDPDFEFHPPREAVEAGFFEPTYRGAAGYRKYVSELADVWGSEMRVESVEIVDLGDRVVMLLDIPMRAQASRVPLTGRLASVATLERGRVVRQQDYFDHAEALRAVGLPE
jgi:ketosteroid isomerase-like protein